MVRRLPRSWEEEVRNNVSLFHLSFSSVSLDTTQYPQYDLSLESSDLRYVMKLSSESVYQNIKFIFLFKSSMNFPGSAKEMDQTISTQLQEN